MGERLDMLVSNLDRNVLLRHAKDINNQEFTMSERFSAGQY